MGQVYYKDRDGLTQGFTIAGDTPTATEQERISAMLAGNPIPTAAVPEQLNGLRNRGSCPRSVPVSPLATTRRKPV